MAPLPEQLRRWLGPPPGRRETHVMCLLALAAGGILCGISVWRGFRGEAFLGRPLGGDFVLFYVAGKILNTYTPWRIYDLPLAVGLQHAMLPTMAKTQMLVFAHAPYVAWLFRPFALLPYAWAYVTWLAFSAALYLLSLGLLFRSTGVAREYRKTAFLLAGSFMPFLFETWIGGQISVLAFFVWVLFLYFRHRQQLFWAGAALALAAFKPTMIGLAVVMLLCGRRWKVLAGLAVGTAGMALLSLATVGWQGCQAWIQTLLFSARYTARSLEAHHLAKNVDIVAFLRLLLGDAGVLAAAVLVAAAAAGCIALSLAWWRLRPNGAQGDHRPEDLLWAATLSLMLVINSYAPIYDAILAVAAVALVAGTPAEPVAEEPEAFTWWMLLLYMSAWITQSFAEYLHVQLITLALAGFGAWALRLAYLRSKARYSNQPAGEEGSWPAVKLLSPQENLRLSHSKTGR